MSDVSRFAFAQFLDRKAIEHYEICIRKRCTFRRRLSESVRWFLTNEGFLSFIEDGFFTFFFATRWSSTFSSKVNLHDAINFRAKCGANLVT